MNRIPFGWLAAVLVPSLVLAYTAGAQATAPATPTGSNLARTHPVAPLVIAANWPPKPQDLVSVAGFFNLAPGTSDSVYAVPANRIFVLTDARAVAAVGNVWDLELLQQHGMELSIKRTLLGVAAGNEASASAGGLGTVFAPGSEIRLRENAGSPYATVTGRYELIGYLAQP